METLIEPNRMVNFSDLDMKEQLTEEERRDQVYEVVDRLTGATYLLKELHSLSGDRAEISREIEILKQLDHPNILKCLEVFEIGDEIHLLLEHMDGGCLVDDCLTTEFSLASVAHQVLSGLRYLHQNKIRHGDICPSNFFINSAEQVKILYLGKTLSNTPVDSNELEATHDEFSWDVWSLGLSILKLSKGLKGFRYTEFGDAIGAEEVHKSPAPPSTELWMFLSCCMQTKKDVSDRWTAEKLLCHPFFDQISASSLKKKREFSVVHASVPSEAILSYKGQISLMTKKPKVSVSVASEATISYEEEQISPKTKKPKVSVESEQGIDEVGSSEVRTTIYRKCFQHCALFLPDSEFERDKLVQMWLAEEFFSKVELTKRMEDTANFYFDVLLNEEIIIPSKFDQFFCQMKYKVNTSKLPTWFRELDNYLRIDEDNLDIIHGEVLHLQWHGKKLDHDLFDALKNFKQLRTLLVHVSCNTLIKQLPIGMFLGLKLLRTLDLSGTHISEVPESVGLLESLRCLDVSETPVKRLPESIDRLHFLQTLKLRGCFGLSALPRGLGLLINLRHLDLHNIVGQLDSMPREMGNLINLQTLQAFIVGKNERCGIRELRNMNEITGSFTISRLENVSSAEEAMEAALSDKKHIDKLELRWRDFGNDNSQDTADILECLQPHFHLKELHITFYSGSKLPSWISNPSFTDLTTITLYKCINCDILPSIGELPSLMILLILGMTNVRDINTLFFRNCGTQGFNAFPKLEKLTLENMSNLEEWTGIEDGDFPCLSHISIKYCPKLSVLPSMSNLCSLQHFEAIHCMRLISLPKLSGSLESLIIKDCPIMSEHYSKDGGQEIAYIRNRWIDFETLSLD